MIARALVSAEHLEAFKWYLIRGGLDTFAIYLPDGSSIMVAETSVHSCVYFLAFKDAVPLPNPQSQTKIGPTIAAHLKHINATEGETANQVFVRLHAAHNHPVLDPDF